MQARAISRRSILASAGALAAPYLVTSKLRAQAPKLKLFIHWDMDGSNGIFTREQSWYWENGVPEETQIGARKLFTNAVNAASEAALKAGATELIVCDTHHGGGNLIRDMLLTDSRITYLYRSVGIENGKRRWLPGMDRTVDGLLLPGHHAKAFTPNCFLPHTWNIEWADFTINGMSVGEIGIEACYAGHWDVPLLFVHGDEAACYEARTQFPWIVTTPVKRGTTDSCTGLPPEEAHRATAKGIAEAIEGLRAGRMKPYKPKLPMTITLRFRTMDDAAKAAQRPGVRRLDDHLVEARVGSQAEVVKWLIGTGLDMAPA